MSVHLSAYLSVCPWHQTYQRSGGATSRNSNWMEPETDKTKESFTTKMFSSIDTRDIIIVSFRPFVHFLLVTIGHKTNVQWKTELGDGPPTSHGAHFLSMVSCICLLVVVLTYQQRIGMRHQLSQTDLSLFCLVFLRVAGCRFTIDSVQYIPYGTPSDLSWFWPKFYCRRFPCFKNTCSG